MKNTNVKVIMNAAGEIEVVGIKANGEVSAVNYTVVETVGVKEFAKSMMAAGAEKQYAALKERASEPKASEHKTPKSVATPQKNKRGYESTKTNGSMFTNMRGIKYNDIYHAVRFEVAGKGECIVGFAKDRNAFMEAFNGEVKEVKKADVLKRIAKYEGKDAAELTKRINYLKPVTMAAGQCACCGTDVSESVRRYSLKNYGEVLCRDCQKDFGKDVKAPSDSEAQLVEDKLPEFGLQYDTCACGGMKLVECEACIVCNNRTWDEIAEQQVKELDAMEASEERNSEAGMESNSLESKPSLHDLFDEGERIVNTGIKGMDASDADSVE